MSGPQVGAGGAGAPPPAPAPAAGGGGLADNVASGLAYITIIPAIIFLVMEPYSKNKVVKFHAFQCLCLAGASIASSVIMIIPILGWIIGPLGHLTVFVLWIICLVKAFSGGKFKVPFLGDMAEKWANA